MFSFLPYYEMVDLPTGDRIRVWGDSSGGIRYRVNDGSVHHLDESVELQTRMLDAILNYHKTLKLGIDRNSS